MVLVRIGQSLTQLENDLGLSRADFAAALKVTPLTIGRWHSGETFPQAGARARIEELGVLRDELLDTFRTREAAREWLREPSSYLGNFTPLDALRLGYVDRVKGALEVLGQGIFI